MEETVEHQVPLWTILAEAAQTLSSAPAAAEARMREMLNTIPAEQHCLSLLVAALKAQGNSDGARATLESMAAKTPDLAAIHFELGMLLSTAGDRSAAIAELKRTVELEPKHPTAWRILGDALAETGDSKAAAASYVRQFQSSIMDVKLLEKMSSLGPDDAETSVKLLREFLTIYSTDANAMRMLARLYMRDNQLDAAEKLLERTIRLEPGFATAQHDYFWVLRTQMKREEQNRQLDILLERQPENPEYRFLKSEVLVQLGKTREALDYCEEILKDEPGNPRFWLAYALALRSAGRATDCIAAFRKAIELQPGLGEAWWGLANLKTFRFSARDIDSMRTRLENEGLAVDDRAALHFALGKALEDSAAYEESFGQYSRGNADVRSQNPYDAKQIEVSVKHEKARFTREFFASHKNEGSPSTAPIFVLGLPRSGSTLIEQVLASHSAVEGAGELPALTAIVMRLLHADKTGASPNDADPVTALTASDLKSLGEEYIERTRPYRKLGRAFFTDKMPTNFHHLGFICAILPNARIIDVRRHPLACCFSNFKQLFPSRQGPSYDLADIGLYYRGYVDLMAHFDAVLPGRIHRIFYEDFVSDPETQTRALLDYCGLPFEESCLRFYETERPILTVSSEQVRQPVFRDSVEQWRHYERWLGPLKKTLGPVLDSYADIRQRR